jgi:AraC-like DNA-binding protein
VNSQIRFLDLVADALHDPLLGFHLARDADIRRIGLMYYVFASSETVGDALRRLARYSRTVNEGVSLRCVDEGESFVVSLAYIGVPRHSDRHQIECWVTTLVRVCRELSGQHVVPNGVKLAHRRGDAPSEFEDYMGTAVEFGVGVDVIALPRAVKDMRVLGADRHLNEVLIAYCEEALARRVPAPGGVPSEVANAIASLLPHGKARLDEVARTLGMSRRTLTRRLAAEGLTFVGVLNRLRLDLAQRHIKDADLSISQIAWLLGYQEVSAFTHAFKHWTGRTPRAARAEAGLARM